MDDGDREHTLHLLRHHRSCQLVVVARDAYGGVATAYRPVNLRDALDCLIRGFWGEPEVAEAVRDDPEAYEEVPEDRYGDELDNMAAWLACL
jgi:hypothetical protein